jgi:hypothetical protein
MRSTTVLNAFDLGTMLEVGWLILALGGATTSWVIDTISCLRLN